MGAILDYRIIETDSRWDAIAEFEAMQKQARIQYGNCYSGTISELPGVQIYPLSADDEKSAIDCIANNHEKRGKAQLVRFMDRGIIKFAIGGWCSS